jgi:hypothetical protein
MGVFAKSMTDLAARAQETGFVMIDATHAKAHRTSTSLAVQKRGADALIGLTKGGLYSKLRVLGRRAGPPDPDVPVGAQDLGLHRGAGAAAFHPGSVNPAPGPGLQRRLVPQRPDRDGQFSLHSVPRCSKRSYPTRRRPLSLAPQGREHVRPPQRLAPHRNPL